MQIKDVKPVGHDSVKIIMECPYCGCIDSTYDTQKTLEIQTIKCPRCGKTNEDSGLLNNRSI